MKKFLALFITFILIFDIIKPSYANLIDSLKEVTPNSDLGTVTIDNIDGNVGAINDSAGKLNSIAQIFIDTFESVSSLLSLPLRAIISKGTLTIEGAIWAKQSYLQLTFFNADKESIAFADIFKSKVASVYNGFRYLVAAFYIIILVYLGIRMILSSLGKQKAHYKTLLQYWLTGLLLLFTFHWVMAFMIWGSYQLTDAFASLGETAFDESNSSSQGFAGLFDNQTLVDLADYITSPASVTEFIINRISDFKYIPFLKDMSNTVMLIGLLWLLIFAFKISYTYLKRLFTIAFLIIIFPIVVLTYVFDKIGDRRSQTFNWWLKEFMVNVFIQPIHAFILALIACMLASSQIFRLPLIGFILSMLSLSLLSIIEKQMKTIFQIESQMGPGHGGFANSFAHFGLALNTLKGLGASAVNTVKSVKNLQNADNWTNNILNSAGDKAFNSVYNSSKKTMSEDEARKKAIQARNKAIEDKKLSLKNDKNYKNRIRELTGHSNIETARASLRRGLIGGSIGALFAVPDTLAGAESLNKLFPSMISKATTSASIASSLVGTANEFIKLKDKTESPELDKAEEIMNKDPKTWTPADKDLISEISGINVRKKKKINSGMIDLISRKINSRKKALQYGITFDNPAVNLIDEDLDEIRNIRAGKDPSDSSKPIDFNKRFSSTLTEDGALLLDTETGKLYFDSDFKCPGIGTEEFTQKAGMTDLEFKEMVYKTAYKKAENIATDRGVNVRSTQFKKILDKEQDKYEKLLSAKLEFNKIMASGQEFLSTPDITPLEVNVDNNMTEENIRSIYKSSLLDALQHKYVSQTSVNNIVNNLTQGRFTTLTPNNLDSFTQSESIETLNDFRESFNTIQKMEHDIIPDISRIYNARNSGTVNSPIKVPEDILINMKNTFSPNEGLRVIVHPTDSKTGLAKTEVISIEDSNRAVTFNSDINTYGATKSYAGNFTGDELFRSVEILTDNTILTEDENNEDIQSGGEYAEVLFSELDPSISTDFKVFKKNNVIVIVDNNNTVVFAKELAPDKVAQTDKLVYFDVTIQDGKLIYKSDKALPPDPILLGQLRCHKEGINPKTTDEQAKMISRLF